MAFLDSIRSNMEVNCRQEQFEKSAAGRAVKAQMAAAAKQSSVSSKGEPVLKVFWFAFHASIA